MTGQGQPKVGSGPVGPGQARTMNDTAGGRDAPCDGRGAIEPPGRRSSAKKEARVAGIQEMAKDLGRSMGRTDEYQALRRAMQSMGDDRELVSLRNELEGLEGQIETSLRAGQEPDAEVAASYEQAVSRLQANSTYQRLVSAQTNFDKVVQKVNDTIAEGIREGGESRIILSS